MSGARKKRLGRPPKEDKRVSLNLRVSPDLRGRLVALAEANRSSITEQVESLVEHAMKEYPNRSASSTPAEKQPSDHSLVDEFEKWKGLVHTFGGHITGIALMMCIAMAYAMINSNAWSRDAIKRTRRFPHKQAGETWTAREITELDAFLENSLTGNWGCLDDAYVFGQVASAARYVLAQIAPEGDPSVVPTPPRGIAPGLAVMFMREFGDVAGIQVISGLTTDKETASGVLEFIRVCLGDDVIARLKARSPDDNSSPAEVTKNGP
jgi:hypothetical protein